MTCSAGLMSMCEYSRIIIFWLHIFKLSFDICTSFFAFRLGLSFSTSFSITDSSSLVSPT